MIISVTGPGVCGRTFITYVLLHLFQKRTQFTMLAIDTDYRFKESSLTILLTGFYVKDGLYNYEVGNPLPLYPVTDRLFIVPPGSLSNLSIEVGKKILNIIEKSECDIAIIDLSIPAESPLSRYLLAYSDIIINIRILESFLDLSWISRVVEPKPKILTIYNMSRRIEKKSDNIYIRHISKIYGNLKNIRKVIDKICKDYYIEKLFNKILTFINVDKMSIIRRKIIEELLIW